MGVRGRGDRGFRFPGCVKVDRWFGLDGFGVGGGEWGSVRAGGGELPICFYFLGRVIKEGD